MARVSDVFGSKGLKAEDLRGQDVRVEISSTRICRFDDGDKIEVQFVGKEKSLVCNRTNARTISLVVGSDDLDDWVGHPVTIYPAYVDFKGEQVLAIRVRPPQVAAASSPPPNLGDVPPPLDDDQVPF